MTYLKSINIDSPLTAFGEVDVAQKYAIIQATGVYDVLPANMTTFTASGGAATVTGGQLSVSTGTTSGAYGVIRTVRALQYRAGEGALGRFTAVFTAGVANSGQIAGFFNVGDGLWFGYDGADFGICKRYGGIAECRTITVDTAATGATNLTLTLNSVAYVIPLTIATTAVNAREIAEWLNANQSVWQASQNGSTVIVIANADGALSGTYSYSHATSTGTIVQTRAGVTKTEDWSYLSGSPQWTNPPTWTPAFDPTKGNVYQIRFQYLGYGNIFFDIENPDTGRFETVHVIEYPNQFTIPSLRNPNMRIGIAAFSEGSTTDLTVKSPSIAAFMEGIRTFTRNPRSSSNTKSIGTTLTPILTLRNRLEFNGYYNQGEIQPLFVNIANASTRNAVFEIYTNATLTGYNYSYVNQSNLISEIDTSATALTGGTPIFQTVLAPNSSQVVDFTNLQTKVPPTITFTIAGRVTAGAASDLSAATTWYEEVF